MDTSVNIDIADVIKNYKLLLNLLQPLVTCWHAAIYVLSWDNELVSIGVFIACVLAAYNFETFFFSLCLIGGAFLLLSRWNLIMRREDRTQQPDLRKSLKYIHPNNPHLGNELENEKQVKKMMQEYRHMLLQVNKFMSQINESVDIFYRILQWEMPLYSNSLLFSLCILCLLSVFVSVRILLVIVILLVFCANRGFQEWVHFRVKMCWHWFQNKVVSKVAYKQSSSQQPLPHPTAASSNVQATDLHQDALDRSQDQVVSETEEESSSKHAELQKPEPKKVRHDNVGSCDKCNVSFAKLLKRKHKCNYCGGVYCGSCTVRVKKSLLGATSPSAYSEAVRVCVDCRMQLEEMNLELNKYLTNGT